MIILRDKKFSSEENRIRKMKGKLLLDDLGTVTGIHPLYRKAKEKLTGKKTLYHYTPSKNVESILKNGFDPELDQASEKWKKKHPGETYEQGIYFGNSSKSVPRESAIDRYNSKKRKIARGDEVPAGWGDPGTMLTVKIPLKEYNKLNKRESDPMISKGKTTFKNVIRTNPRFKEDYDKAGILEKLRIRGMVRNMDKHLEKDVVLIKEKVDPKYITKIDKNWS